MMRSKRSTRGPRKAQTAHADNGPHGAGHQKEPRRVVSPAQCRAARAVLGWTQADLAEHAALARKTIADFEMNVRSLQFRTQRDITATLEAAGIEFIWGNDAEDHHSRAGDVEGVRFSRRLAAKK